MIWKVGGVLVYLAALLYIGVASSRRMNDSRDFFAAGKRLNFWAVAFSARATGESAWLLLGLTGMGAAIGARAFWVVVGEVLGVSIAWLLMAGRFKNLTDRYDAITIPDYLEGRFNDKSHLLRLVAAGTLVCFVTIYVSAQIFATGDAFTHFLGWNYYLGVFVGFAVVMTYSISGGFLAVVVSDIFQGALMFIGLVSLPIVGLFVLGGPGQLIDGLQAIDPSLLTLSGVDGWTTTTVLGTIGLCLIGLGFLGSPQIFVRFLALRDVKEIPKGSLVAIAWTLLADSGAVLTGMVGRAMLTKPGEDVVEVLGNNAESVLPNLVDHVLPAALVGLFIAIVLSAIMSTVDSLLVVASSALVRDVYQQVLHPNIKDSQLVFLSRIATFGLALIALIVALVVRQPGQTVFWFVIFGWSGIAATFCPTIILSLFWKGFTTKGALAAMITGFLCVPFFQFGAPALITKLWPQNSHWVDNVNALTELPPAFAISMLTAVIVSLLDKSGRQRLANIQLKKS